MSQFTKELPTVPVVPVLVIFFFLSFFPLDLDKLKKKKKLILKFCFLASYNSDEDGRDQTQYPSWDSFSCLDPLAHKNDNSGT